ncbi:yihQ [Linum perenne]
MEPSPPPPPTTAKITKKHHKHLNNPFPSPPKSLPYLQGGLSFNHLTIPLSPSSFPIGPDFQLHWSPKSGGSLSIAHKTRPDRTLWSTVPGQAFVSAVMAETEVEESRGSFSVKDGTVHLVCEHQTVEEIRVVGSETESPGLVVTGRLLCKESKRRKVGSGYSARYSVRFVQKSGSEVGFEIRVGSATLTEAPIQRRMMKTMSFRTQKKKKRKSKKKKGIGSLWRSCFWNPMAVVSSSEVSPAAKEFNRVVVTYASDGEESFYGFGEQFSHMDLKGKRVPIFVQEQGIGRGDQPITFAANLVSYRAGGDWSTTYAPSPFYITSNMRSLYLDGYSYSVFDLTRPDRVQIQMHGNSISGTILHGETPTDLIERFTATIGRPPMLPKWVISGAVVGMQGGTESVREVWDKLEGYEVPISAFWLQDWVGQRETVIGSQLWWNWEVDGDRYKGWKELVRELGDRRVRVMTYCNPCLAPTDEKENRRRSHFEEAKKLGILVKDKEGEPYMVPNTAFSVGMLDFTHPNAGPWFKQVLKEMVEDGVRGWMADFGEGLPVDASLFSGECPIEAHNRYPELWAQVNREFVEEWKASSNHHKITTKSVTEEQDDEDADDEESSLVFFMRAGFRNSPKWGMLFWEGDQMVSWQRNDGIKSAVVGLLSGGISGYALNHSDIGGYCCVDLPPFMGKYRRSEELLMRWMELSAFTAVFRTHEGNKPSSNAQFYSNHATLSQFARCAKLYKAWYFYRLQLVKEASEKGLPICRHMFLHYPSDRNVGKLSYQQFLVGTEIMVVPVLDKGKKEVKAYFPKAERGSWEHVWSGKVYEEVGFEAWVDAPVGYPAVFVRAGSAVGERFLGNLRRFGIV